MPQHFDALVKHWNAVSDLPGSGARVPAAQSPGDNPPQLSNQARRIVNLITAPAPMRPPRHGKVELYRRVLAKLKTSDGSWTLAVRSPPIETFR